MLWYSSAPRAILRIRRLFPALQAMMKRGTLTVPVIGVAKAGWGLDQLKTRAKDSLVQHGGLDEAAWAKLEPLLRYVDGDYSDPATFEAVREALGKAEHPAHYLAIPPSMFETVVEQLVKSGSAKGARMIVEKPFGHDLASAQELNRILLGAFDEASIFRIDHYLAKGPVQNMVSFRFSQLVSGAVVESGSYRERPDHDGRGLRSAGTRGVLRPDRNDSGCDPESFVSTDV